MKGRSDADRHEAGRYEIRLKGHLDKRWASFFDGLQITHERGGTTVIHGTGLDQAALHGLLQKVRDTGLALISVSPSPSPPDTQPAPTTDFDRHQPFHEENPT